MSLRPDDRSSRTRSRSKSRSHEKDRSRSRSHVRAPSPPQAVAPVRKEYSSYPMAPSKVDMPSMPGGFDDYPVSTNQVPRGGPLPYPSASPFPDHESPYSPQGEPITWGGWKDLPPEQRPGYDRHSSDHQSASPNDSDLAYGSTHHPGLNRQHSSSVSSTYDRGSSGYYGNPAQHQYTPPPTTTAGSSYPGQYAPTPSTGPGPYTSSQHVTAGTPSTYQKVEQYQYAAPPSDLKYTPQTQPSINSIQSSASRDSVRRTASGQHAHVVDITPGGRHRSSSSLVPQIGHLSVGGRTAEPGHGGTLPPPSPMLEAYRGTWGSISPMVAPMSLAGGESDLSDIEPLSSTTSKSDKKHKRHSSKADKPRHSRSLSQRDSHIEKERTQQPMSTEKRRVKLYDAEEDARSLSAALSRSHPDSGPVIDILPHLTHDQILELRTEYKKHAKVSGRGINIAKHIKLKLSGNFGKAAHVVALGKYESEGYWANFFYQSHASRRELLIESLFGCSNAFVREVKDGFRDKRYADDLRRCMEKELKADKFRTAVLMVLEEKRQEETDVYPIEVRNRDVEVLERCLRAKEGGESAMLDVVVRRSDAHLREVMAAFERVHGVSFAREALRKCNNLVGEVLAHILNGAINKPARDALLLHHALSDVAAKNKDDDLRYELLISRLVRIHWDRPHLLRVKRAYADKYGREVEDDLEDCTKGDFGEFVLELCDAA